MSKIKRLLLTAISVVAAMSTLCALIAVYAQGNESVLKYTVPVSYIVEIPASITIEYEEASHPIGSIKAEDVHVEVDKCVKVSLENSDNLALINEKDGHELHYSIKDGKGNVFSEKRFTENGTVDDLSICISTSEWYKATSGSYSNTATFNISYVDR